MINESWIGIARYRSRGEAQIARLLDRYRIDYLYEHPLAVVDRGLVRVWYPDFQLPRYGVLIEYFGREGDPAYEACMKHKQEVYGQMGLPVVYLDGDAFRGDWPGRILGQIQGVMEKRLVQWHAAVQGRARENDARSVSGSVGGREYTGLGCVG